ncbi:MAG: hypothetical protein QM673_12760 [Gordonia sp. (in: high G+C Gram-positive bacteria)]
MTSSSLIVAADAKSEAALLTLSIAAYSAAILAGIGIGIYAITHHRRRLAIAMGTVVGVLTLAGVIIAVGSSIA